MKSFESQNRFRDKKERVREDERSGKLWTAENMTEAILAHIESLPAESEEDQFVLDDIRDTLSDILPAINDNPEAAQKQLNQVIEEYGDWYNLSEIVQRIPEGEARESAENMETVLLESRRYFAEMTSRMSDTVIDFLTNLYDRRRPGTLKRFTPVLLSCVLLGCSMQKDGNILIPENTDIRREQEEESIGDTLKTDDPEVWINVFKDVRRMTDGVSIIHAFSRLEFGTKIDIFNRLANTEDIIVYPSFLTRELVKNESADSIMEALNRVAKNRPHTIMPFLAAAGQGIYPALRSLEENHDFFVLFKTGIEHSETMSDIYRAFNYLIYTLSPRQISELYALVEELYPHSIQQPVPLLTELYTEGVQDPLESVLERAEDTINVKVTIQMMRELFKNDSNISPSYHFSFFMREHYHHPDMPAFRQDIVRTRPSLFLNTFYSEQLLSMEKEDGLVSKVVRSMTTEQVADVHSYIISDLLEDRALRALFREKFPYIDFAYRYAKKWIFTMSFLDFMRDPSLPMLDLVSAEVVREIDSRHLKSQRDIDEMRLMIARNLHFSGIRPENVSQDGIKREYERIKEMRERMKDVNLFEGRNVLLIADNERWLQTVNENMKSGPYRFGNNTIMQAMERQQGTMTRTTYLHRFRADGSEYTSDHESVLRMKQDILQEIRETTGFLTIYFDAHGEGGRVFLDRNTAITSGEIADALNDRHNHTRTDEKDEPVIIISGSCFNINQMHNIFKYLDDDVPKPIFIGASDYGQMAVSNPLSRYGGPLEEKILRNYKDTSATIGNIVNEFAKPLRLFFAPMSNPSVYVPDKKNNPMQISEVRMATDDTQSFV